MARERPSCFTCRLLELRRAADGRWTCWCTIDDEDIGKVVVTRKACAAHVPRGPEAAACLLVEGPLP